MAASTIGSGRTVHKLFSGPCSLPAGSVKIAGTPEMPVRRRVVLHDQSSGLPVRQMWSDAATGAYQFQNVRAGTYFVIAFDQTGTYSAEVESDLIAQEVS